MTPLPVAAVSAHAQVAGETPHDLRAELRTVCPNAPRRLNRLIELALIGAHRCVQRRALPPDTAIYTAFTSGCIGDSSILVNSVVRGRPTMPVTFINVSSNMAGFYVASTLGLHSANHVVSCNDFAWESALELALLGSAARRGLLLGAVEECAWPLAEHRDRLHLPPGAAVLETSHWLLADRSAPAIGAVHEVRRLRDDADLAAWLAPRAAAADTRLRVHGAGDEEAAAVASQSRLPRWAGGDAPGFTGLPAALACCRFLAGERGTLVHLARGGSGAWYAVVVAATPSSG